MGICPHFMSGEPNSRLHSGRSQGQVLQSEKAFQAWPHPTQAAGSQVYREKGSVLDRYNRQFIPEAPAPWFHPGADPSVARGKPWKSQP